MLLPRKTDEIKKRMLKANTAGTCGHGSPMFLPRDRSLKIIRPDLKTQGKAVDSVCRGGEKEERAKRDGPEQRFKVLKVTRRSKRKQEREQ